MHLLRCSAWRFHGSCVLAASEACVFLSSYVHDANDAQFAYAQLALIANERQGHLAIRTNLNGLGQISIFPHRNVQHILWPDDVVKRHNQRRLLRRFRDQTGAWSGLRGSYTYLKRCQDCTRRFELFKTEGSTRNPPLLLWLRAIHCSSLTRRQPWKVNPHFWEGIADKREVHTAKDNSSQKTLEGYIHWASSGLGKPASLRRCICRSGSFVE